MRGVKKNCCHTFFCNHKFHKMENYFIFELLKNKIWVNFQRIIEFFIKRIVTKLSGFGIRDPGKTYPGSQTRGPKGTGSRIRIRNTAFQVSVFPIKLEKIKKKERLLSSPPEKVSVLQQFSRP